jgi:hypothetical protein
MSLTTTVLANNNIGALRTWQGIATSCHFATVYWLYMTEFGNELTLAALGNIGAPQAAVTQMVAHGVHRTRPANGPLILTAGSVLVFFANGSAAHSCVAVGAQTAAGYNQVGWWGFGGVDHGYSMHLTSQLRWGAGANKHDLLSGGTWHDLYEIPEFTARGILRNRVF